MTRCACEGCIKEARAGGLCWEHQMCGIEIDSEKVERFKKRVSEIPVLGTVPTELPRPDVSVSDKELDKAIERRQKEDALIALENGKVTFWLVTENTKRIGIWKLLGALATIVTWWFGKSK